MPATIETTDPVTIHERVEQVFAPSAGTIPEGLEDIALHCAQWRATTEVAYFWDVDRTAFAGRCADEAADLAESLRSLAPDVCFDLAEFMFLTPSGRAVWHVAVAFLFRGRRWIADMTADQFGPEFSRLVFAPRPSLPHYRRVPARRREPRSFISC